jgi:hypothetical protein
MSTPIVYVVTYPARNGVARVRSICRVQGANPRFNKTFECDEAVADNWVAAGEEVARAFAADLKISRTDHCFFRPLRVLEGGVAA